MGRLRRRVEKKIISTDGFHQLSKGRGRNPLSELIQGEGWECRSLRNDPEKHRNVLKVELLASFWEDWGVGIPTKKNIRVKGAI